MNKSLKWFFVIATLFASPTFAQVFTNQADFQAVCPDLELEDFQSAPMLEVSELVPESQVFDSFTLSAFGNTPEGMDGSPSTREQLPLVFGAPVGEDSNQIVASSVIFDTEGLSVANEFCLEFSQNSNSFSIEYQLDMIAGGGEFPSATIELLDAAGNTIVIDDLQAVGGAVSFWGYTGTETIAQVKMIINQSFVGIVLTGEIAFDLDVNATFLVLQNVSSGICVQPAPETCFDQIALIKADLAVLVSESEGRELRNLRNAFNCLCILEDPIFWQDDNTRLSCYGSTFFIGGAYTIAFLDKSDNPDVEPIIASLLDTLECIVDNEIDFAIENAGRDFLIERAENYAYVADALYEDFDLPVVSALAYRLAWLNAFYATY